MTWEQKTELCKHLNKGEYSSAAKMVLDNEMDAQAWDMFLTGVLLTDESVKENRELYLKVFEKSKDQKYESYGLALRASIFDHLITKTI